MLGEDFQEAAYKPTRIKCFQRGQAEGKLSFKVVRDDGWGWVGCRGGEQNQSNS